MKPKPYKPEEKEWFAVAPTFVWRCCKCGHAAKMQVRTQMSGVVLKAPNSNDDNKT